MGYETTKAHEQSNRKFFEVGNKKGKTDEETAKLKKHCLWLISKESEKGEVEFHNETKGNFYTGIEYIEGMLKSIILQKIEGNGKFDDFYVWEITMFDDGKEMVISMDLESKFAADFFKRIDRANFDLPIIIKAFHLARKVNNVIIPNKFNKYMPVYQRDVSGTPTIIKAYYDSHFDSKTNQWVSVNGYPLLDIKEVTDDLTGEVTKEYNNRKQLAFMNKIAKEVTEKLESARLKKAEEARAKQQPQTIVPTTELPTYADDLPF